MRLPQLFAAGRKKVKDEPITLEQEIKVINERKISIGYPHLTEIVKEKCPDCGSKMTHDSFQKSIDLKGNLWACYQCTDCGERIMFDINKGKFTKTRMENHKKTQDGRSKSK